MENRKYKHTFGGENPENIKNLRYNKLAAPPNTQGSLRINT